MKRKIKSITTEWAQHSEPAAKFSEVILYLNRKLTVMGGGEGSTLVGEQVLVPSRDSYEDGCHLL